MEFDLLLKPAARPDRIRLQFGGASDLALDSDGALRLHSRAGELRFPAPVVYQEIAGQRRRVAAKYVILPRHQVAFHLASYDRTQPLVIDPTIVYSSLIGGEMGATTAYSVAVDGAGNTYIAGTTNSADFPTVNAAYPQLREATGAFQSAFISKLDPTGTTVLYSTYVNGIALNGNLQSIAVDSFGDAWVAGSSASTEFPVVNGPQSTPAGSSAVVMQLGPTGLPRFSTYWGAYCNGNAIAVDANGNAYLIGFGNAGTLTQVPTTPGAYQTTQYSPQVGAASFVTKFNSSGTVVYSTYLGAGNASAIAVDSNGNTFVTGTGYANSFQNVPPGGAQPSIAGNSNAFVLKLNAAGAALNYFTFLGGSGLDSGAAIAVDGNGNAYVGGSTTSANFPVTAGALQTVFGGGTDGFAAKLNSSGSAFEYVTYLGGNRVESVAGIAVDNNGIAYVTGQTDSADFPIAAAIDRTLTGNPYSLYQTSNVGASWTAVDGTVPGAVTSISPDPSTPGAIVAGTEVGIFRSTDGGQSWTQTSTLANAYLSRSPVNPSIIYEVDSYTSRHRSSDGGQTWGYLGLCCDYYVQGTRIIADGANAEFAYSYDPLSNGGVNRLDSFGGVIQMSGGFFAQVTAMATAPDGTIYGDVNGLGVYRGSSQSPGSVPADAGLPPNSSATYGDLAISPSNPSTLYKSIGNQIYVTTNGAGSWALAGTAPVPLGALAVSATNPSVVYGAALSTSPALYISMDGGATWNPTGSGLGVAAVDQIVPDPVIGSAAYVLAPVEPVAFAAAINPTGTGLAYSTYLGSFGALNGYAIALSSSGDAIVAGEGSSTFPTPAPGGFLQYLTPQAVVLRISAATASCTFNLNPASQVVYGSASQLNFALTAPSGCSWTASSDQSWATVQQGTSGAGSSVIYVDVTANTTGAARTANISLGNQTFSMTQAPSSCSYFLNPSSFSIGNNGGLVETTVTSGGAVRGASSTLTPKLSRSPPAHPARTQDR
jgi:hypothetical protein